MHYLYGSKRSGSRRLVATFGSGPQRGKFEQQSALTSCDAWEQSTDPLTDEDASEVDFNPTPSML